MLLLGRKYGVLASVAAISCGVTYLVCEQVYEARTAELQEQISDLQKKELQAKVTQRVSEQMEDIAFQQKDISDKQREEAVRQSRIADMEREGGNAAFAEPTAKAVTTATANTFSFII